jgi:hypothetical protein
VHWVAIILIGALVGYLGGMFGKGGSAIATPLLAAAGVPAIVAVASPLPATVPGTLVAYRRYRHLGLSDPSVIRTSLAVGIPATLLGAWASRWIAGGTLLVVTDVVVALIGLRTPPSGAPAGGRRRRSLSTVGCGSSPSPRSSACWPGSSTPAGFLLVPLYLAALKRCRSRPLACSLAVARCWPCPAPSSTLRWARSTGGWPSSSGRRQIPSPGSGRRRPWHQLRSPGAHLTAPALRPSARRSS